MQKLIAKKTFRAFIAFTLVLVTVCTGMVSGGSAFRVSAATMAEAQAQVSRLQQELKTLQNTSKTASADYQKALAVYKSAELDVESAKAAKIKLDEEVAALEDEIDKTNEILSVYAEQLAAYESAIDDTQAESDDLFQKCLERIRLNYEDSFTSYLEIVLSSDSFADLLYRVDVVASLLEYDKRVMRQLELSKESLEELWEQYKQMQLDTQEAYESLTKQVPVLEEKRVEAEELIKLLDEKLEEARKAKDESQNAKEAYEKAVEAKKREMANAQAELDKRIKEAEEAERAKRRAAYVGGTLGWPVDISYNVVSSYFVSRRNPIYGYWETHNGIDIPVPYGTPILAANAGTVIVAEYHYSYGYYIVIDHGGDLSTLYAHNSRLLVSVGDTVVKGQIIAKAGSTGDSTGNHCHFTVRVNGSPVNPLGYVNQP